MMISYGNRRVLAALQLPGTVAGFVAYAEMVVRCMKNSPHFPDPTPPLELVTKATNELRRAQEQAVLGRRGAAPLRDAKQATLGGLLGLVRTYVQGVADLEPGEGLRAKAVIRSAGLSVRTEMERRPVQFRAMLGDEPGLIEMVARVEAGAQYEWQYSLDRGRTWRELPCTTLSRTSLACPTWQRVVVEVRYRAVTRAGAGPWSGVIAIFVP